MVGQQRSIKLYNKMHRRGLVMFHYDLNLRKACEDDLGCLFDLKNEAHEMHHRVALINEFDQENWFKSLDKDVYLPKNLILIGMNPNSNNENIGAIFLTNINYINRTSDIGIDVYKQHRNKKFGTRLMHSGIDFCRDVLNLRKLSCEILEYNLASQKMCEKNGFICEGVKKEEVYKSGKYIDSLIYGLLISK